MNTTESPVVKAPEQMEGAELAESVGQEVFGGSLAPGHTFLLNIRTDGIFLPSDPRAVALVKETMRQRGCNWSIRDLEDGSVSVEVKWRSAIRRTAHRMVIGAGPDEGTAVFRVALAVARVQKEKP